MNNKIRLLLPAILALAACAQAPKTSEPAGQKPASVPLSQLMKRPGGFYNDDAPDGPLPVNLDAIRDAEPRPEPLNGRANEPYTVFGREYTPYKALVDYRRQGTVSWYGRKFHGQRTWSGEFYDMYAMTAAHPTLPIPSYVRVTNLENRRSVVVRINDRGPFHSGRIMDLSYAAAWRLGFAESGSATVEVESVVPAVTGVIASAPASPRKPVPAEPPEAAPVMAASTLPGGIFLQLGAFGAEANAESFRSKLQPQLAELQLTAQVTERDRLHRVQVGPFRTRAEATQMVEKLRESLGIRAIVVVR